jgi:hypothetical protein
MPAIDDVVEDGSQHTSISCVQGRLKVLVDELQGDHVRSPLFYQLVAMATQSPNHGQTIPRHDGKIVGYQLLGYQS